MKNKILSLVFIIVLGLFTLVMPAMAQIKSEFDITNKRNQIQTILNTEFMSFVNKNELIGYKLDAYNMESQYYKNYLYTVIEKLNNQLTQINIIRTSQDLSDTDKTMKLNDIFQDVDVTLYDVDAKTITYLSNCKRSMPSITYQKFTKTFEKFYNAFQLTNTQVNVY